MFCEKSQSYLILIHRFTWFLFCRPEYVGFELNVFLWLKIRCKCILSSCVHAHFGVRGCHVQSFSDFVDARAGQMKEERLSPGVVVYCHCSQHVVETRQPCFPSWANGGGFAVNVELRKRRKDCCHFSSRVRINFSSPNVMF